ncbi:MAG: peptidase M23, partial [Rhodothermales bacterium]
MLESRFLRYSASAAALAAIFMLALFVGRGRPLYQAAQLAPAPVKSAKAQKDEFGIISSSFDVIDRKIQRNETFAEMLTAHNIPYSEVVQLAETAQPVFDVRAMRAGSRVRFYRDSLSTARYMVYQNDAINYVVFDLTDDSPRVYDRQRPVQIERRRLSGVINGSLYETLSEVGAAGSLVPLLATGLSEVFAWQIDFYRIQADDEFSVIYEERSIDGEPIGMGKIVAAHFVHGGEDFYGIHFDRGERPDYYDFDGNSLRKA